MSEPVSIDVYIDYLCPYAHAGASWLRDVRAQLDGNLTINWKFFPLEQVNSDKGPDWKVWEQSTDHRTRGWEGFRAAVAALNQGDEAFERFHFAWFAALHDVPVGVKRQTVFEVAEAAGLDTEQFARDFSDTALWTRVGADYRDGKEGLGVFGTPTIVFENGASAYIQTRPAPPKEEALDVWNDFVELVSERPYLKEIKRPVKPRPVE
ncbi:MAG: DsbA family protein [Thermomicrobiales bacterium]|nr:DsbA family protein [Thermomicrobiales bacterium]